jgi:heme/copper-type cytochrome/quinol oxidase subunit 1
MKKFKAYYLLLISSLILLMLGFLVCRETLDINLHDTYYVIMRNHLYWLISILLVLFFLIYLLFDKVKINFEHLFSKVHIFGTLISVIGLLFPYSLIFSKAEFPLYDYSPYINLSMTISILVFLMFQILFIIVIFVSIIKRMKSFLA